MYIFSVIRYLLTNFKLLKVKYKFFKNYGLLKEVFNINIEDDIYIKNLFYLNGVQILYCIYTYNSYYYGIRKIVENGYIKAKLNDKNTRDNYIDLYNLYFNNFFSILLLNEGYIVKIMLENNNINKNDILKQKDYFILYSNNFIKLILDNYLLITVYDKNSYIKKIIIYYILNLYLQNFIDLIFMYSYNFNYYKRYLIYNNKDYNDCLRVIMNYISLIYYISLTNDEIKNYKDIILKYNQYIEMYYSMKKQIILFEYENFKKSVNNFSFNSNNVNLVLSLYIYLNFLEDI